MFETTVINPIHFKYKYSNIGGVCNYFGLLYVLTKKIIFRKIDHSGSAEARHLTFALLDDLRNELPPDHWNSHHESFLTDF